MLLIWIRWLYASGEDPGWRCLVYAALPQHFLNFLPEPQGHGSLRPTLVGVRAGLVDEPDGSGIEICFGPFSRE